MSQELVFTNPPFKQCHASKIVENKKGEILLSFFGGSQEGKKDVSIWLAKVNGRAEPKPLILADGIVNDTLRYPTWNPVLFREDWFILPTLITGKILNTLF